MMTFDGSDVGQLTPFWEQVEAAALEFGAQLVVIDTAADTFGGNENERPAVRQFIQRACIGLAQHLDGAVLLCAHPSLSGINSGRGDGGSTAWTNTMRSRLYLNWPPKEDGDDGEDEGTDLRLLTTMKANYGPAGQAITLRWQEGCFVPVRSRANDTVENIEERANYERVEAAFLAALDKLTAQGRNVSHSKQAKNYGPRVMAALGSGKAKWRDLEEAMERLFEAEVIEVGMVRTGTDRHAVNGIRRKVRSTPEATDADDECGKVRGSGSQPIDFAAGRCCGHVRACGR